MPASAQQEEPGSSQTASAAAGGSTLRQSDARVAAVAWRLAKAGTPLCRDPFPLTGLLLHHLAEYEVPDRAEMIARHRLDRGPGVLTVLEGTPAAAAGLRAGDVLLAVNGTAFRPGAEAAAEPKRKKWRRLTDAEEARLESALRTGPAELRVLRDGQELSLRLGSVPGCFGRVRLARSKQVNAYATDDSVILTTAMLEFLASEDELAVVLGHELAHTILGHHEAHGEEGLLEGLGIKPSAKWKREEAADRLGLRLVAAAGYDLDAAIPFWRRYLSKYDWFPQIFRSHPSLGARERIAAEEIAAIRAAGS